MWPDELDADLKPGVQSVENESFGPTQLTFAEPTGHRQSHSDNSHVPFAAGKDDDNPRVLIDGRLRCYIRVAPEWSVEDECATHARREYRRLETHILRAVSDLRESDFMPVTDTQQFRLHYLNSRQC